MSKIIKNDAIKAFRNTFNAVRRNLAKQSGLGYSFAISKVAMYQEFRVAMSAAKVPATPSRLQMVSAWIERASQLGCDLNCQ
jgi:hypothetical protein